MDFDDVLPDIGEYGRYQKLMLCFVLLPGFLPSGFHSYNQLFMSLIPDHGCSVPEMLSFNLSREARQKLTLPPSKSYLATLAWPGTSRPTKFSRCKMYAVNYSQLLENVFRRHSDDTWRPGRWPEWGPVTTTTTVAPDTTASPVWWTPNASWPVSKCTNGWEYYQQDRKSSSVVSDWDLVCHREYLVPLSLSVFSIGGLIGNIIFGFLQDSIGRRPSFFIYLLVLSAFGTATAFATDFPTWLVLRFFNGLAIPAIMGTPYVLAVELVGPAQRTSITIITNIVYSVVLVSLSTVVYLVQEWHQLALATTVPFVAFFLYWWVLPESPRWLLAHAKFEETEKTIRTIAHVNRRPLPPDYMVALKRRFQIEYSIKNREDQNQRAYNVADLFRTPNLRKKTIIITYIWFATCCVYVGLSYYAPVMPGDRYFNFFLSTVAELPAYLFLWPSMEYWGRRWTLCTSLIVGGAACVITVCVQEDSVVMLCLYAVGKFGIAAAFCCLPLMASELYPTVVRGVGLTFSSFVSMIGPVSIPWINHLGEKMLALPLIVMGCMLICGGLCSLMLPETLNQRLPQTLHDGEQFGQVSTFREWLKCCPPKRQSYESASQVDEEEIFGDDRPESPLRSLVSYRETGSDSTPSLSSRRTDVTSSM